ncbi:hypothetical protein MHH81_20655 [Psychrobacillus sp. FSL H8-0484]|uniref:hypothetical protein n=1 Tax=Psychrobacillus sp. FSL H8-0484 TaxID=2921390 RepID=UPI0030FB89A5
MPRKIKRYIEEEPQKYKVIGYSTAPVEEQEVIQIDTRITLSTPLDISCFFREMVQVII